jgi:hypothetical protein
MPVGRFQVYVVVVVGANRITHSDPDREIVTLAELLISCVHKPFASAFDATTCTACAGVIKKPAIKRAITPTTAGFFMAKFEN